MVSGVCAWCVCACVAMGHLDGGRDGNAAEGDGCRNHELSKFVKRRGCDVAVSWEGRNFYFTWVGIVATNAGTIDPYDNTVFRKDPVRLAAKAYIGNANQLWSIGFKTERQCVHPCFRSEVLTYTFGAKLLQEVPEIRNVFRTLVAQLIDQFIVPILGFMLAM